MQTFGRIEKSSIFSPCDDGEEGINSCCSPSFYREAHRQCHKIPAVLAAVSDYTRSSRDTKRGTYGHAQAGIIPVTPFQQNCTIFFDPDTKEGVVVDPGGDVPLILQAIAQNGLTIKEIWLTHGHLDHAGGASELRKLSAST